MPCRYFVDAPLRLFGKYPESHGSEASRDSGADWMGLASATAAASAWYFGAGEGRASGPFLACLGRERERLLAAGCDLG